MNEIIPSILVENFKELKSKIESVENYVNWVHLDISDGNFAPNKTWGDPVMVHDYDPGVFIEAHLMVSAPEDVIDDWIESGVKRIIFHYEATRYHEDIIAKLNAHNVQAGVAILPETPLNSLKLLDGLLDAVLIFSGNLGFYGGEFNDEPTLSKVASLRQSNPNLIIEVDGGMDPTTAKKVVDAGANAIVSGGYIFKSKDIQESITQLQNSVN